MPVPVVAADHVLGLMKDATQHGAMCVIEALEETLPIIKAAGPEMDREYQHTLFLLKILRDAYKHANKALVATMVEKVKEVYAHTPTA